MNMSAIIGIGLTVGAVVLGSIARGSLDLLVDPVSFLFVVLALPLHMLVSYSWQDIKAYGLGGVRPFLFPSTSVQWTPAESLKAARMANTAGVQAIYVGAAGTLIGTVQMLQALEDPKAIGPALSVAGLTLLYGLLMSALIFMPAAQHHEKVALQGGGRGWGTRLRIPSPGGPCGAGIDWPGCRYQILGHAPGDGQLAFLMLLWARPESLL